MNSFILGFGEVSLLLMKNASTQWFEWLLFVHHRMLIEESTMPVGHYLFNMKNSKLTNIVAITNKENELGKDYSNHRR